MADESLAATGPVVIYTDGACLGNPGPGGWAAVLRFGPHRRQMSGAEPNTTNNRMELFAVIAALEAVKRSCEIQLHSDSRYVIDGATRWLPGWRAKNWRLAGGGDVKNRDLWERLDQARQLHRVHWNWVRGHSGDAGNDEVDALARAAAEAVALRPNGVKA